MGHSDVDVKRLSLIDVSFEDDRLIDTSACFVSPLFSVDQSIELSPGLDLQKFQEKGKTMASKPLELVEERSSKTPENYNLRKSLAWDTAFFTSDGVLEPEELSSMIEDAGKKEKRTLPMILEETQRSTESISTLAFDSLTLTSLEDGLFEDIRASIQKSRKTSNIQTFGSEAGQSFSKAHAHPSLRKTDVASHDKLKPKPATKKSSLGMNRPEKTTGQVPVHRRVSQLQTAAVGGASNSNSLPSKPPNLRMRSLLPSSAKRESMTANCMKPKKNSTEGAIGRGASVPKVPLSSGSRSTGPRPSSSRSSFVCSISAKTDMMTTPPESSGTGSSDRTGKSPGILRKKSAVTGSRKLSSASSSKLKTPPRRTLSHLSAHFMSATKLSSSISPSSSISEWSSDSSSSTSIIEQRSNGSSASLKLGSSERSNGRQLDGLKTLGSASSTLHLKNASTRGALLLPNSMRPSGLRMPSPKIGFFDGMISERTLHLDQQSPQVIPSGLPKIGVEISKPDGNINKVKVVKFQSATTTTAMDSMRGDSKQSYLVGSCKSLPPDSSNSVNKVSSMCESMKCPHGLSPTVQGRPPKFGSWNQSKAEEVKAKETYPVTWDDKESAEAEPGSGAWSCKTNAIHGELYISNAIMDLLDGAGSPDKWESHVDHGSVFDYSACTSAFVSQESPHL